MDITDHNTFNKVKDVITSINIDTFPYLKKIIVENKSDIDNKKENKELKKFVNFYSNEYNLDYEEISVKTGENIDELLFKINNEINSEEDKVFAINKVTTSNIDKSSMDNYERSYSVILLGNQQVGKTNFITRYTKNEFMPELLQTTGVNQEFKSVKINNGKLFKLTIWDTAGQERFRSIPLKYYRNADGVLLLYDLLDKNSFEDTSKWMEEITKYCEKEKEEDNNDNSIVVYLIGNKIDLLENEAEIIKEDEKLDLAKNFKVKYYDVSCKWNLNIEEVMARIILDCNRINRQRSKSFSLNNTIRSIKSNKDNSKGCCSSNKKNKG